MASPDSQQTWVPYQNPRDCSQGFCSLYCPQWCYIIFPPPPPFGPPEDDSSGVNFSPLVIAIIGILASAFLLVSYYTIVSKYCANAESLRRRTRRRRDGEYGEGDVQNEQWQTANSGLDEALIKSITVCKYKRGDGLVEGTDCSVCLSEFQEDESLRLLPKCSHAFHVVCIDTWLKSHSNCPLCRACIVSAIPLPPIPNQEGISNQESPGEGQEDDHTITVVEDSERGAEELNTDGRIVSKHPSRALSDMGGLERDTIIEIREEEIQAVRRSFSMDSSRQGRISIADVLGTDSEKDESQDDCPLPTAIRPSKRSDGEHAKGSHSRSRALHGVMSPISMKRSSSGGRFLVTRHGRGRNGSISILN